MIVLLGFYYCVAGAAFIIYESALNDEHNSINLAVIGLAWPLVVVVRVGKMLIWTARRMKNDAHRLIPQRAESVPQQSTPVDRYEPGGWMRESLKRP